MPYAGGKAGAGVKQKIINLMPPHRVYIEPFLGDASIMRAKKPADVNIGLDLEGATPGLAWLASLAGGEKWKCSSGAEMPPGRSHYAIHGDGIQFLQTYQWKGDELVYCDPPYLMSTRTGKRMYKWEWWVDQHRILLQLLKTLPCAVMLSGYKSSLYDELLEVDTNEFSPWNLVTFEAMTRGGHTKTEHLWFNFPPPTVLHDYQHLGVGFRERERIKRKKARWVARLKAMPELERRCLLEAILETSPPRAASSDSDSDSLGPTRT